MKKDEDLQKKILEFQLLDSNLRMLQERAELFNQKLQEVQSTKEALDELENTKPNKAMIPLGSGNFIFGSIDNCDDVLVGVGAGVAVKSNRNKALENLDKRIEELEKSLNDIVKQINVFVSQIEKVQGEIERLQK